MNTSNGESITKGNGNGLQPAVLLIGPTGSGKSPLGDYLEKVGFNGELCTHFDFGSSLRRVARREDIIAGLTEPDIAFVSTVLKGGALLENDKFYIAERIITHFAQKAGIGNNHYLVLNGLPRHVEQAIDVDRLVSVRFLLHLCCTPQVVAERIRMNTGGDRTGRNDDSPAEIQKKIRLFQKRTIPLLEYYRSRGVIVKDIDVNVDTTPMQIVNTLVL